jgi:RNA polymerase sigma factor (sigma-70 family)
MGRAAVETHPVTTLGLASDREGRLAEAARRGGPEGRQAAAILVESIAGFIARMAIRRCRGRAAGTLDRDDLIQAGRLGAIRAIAGFDPARARWITYAAWWVRKAIGEEVADHGRTIRVPRRVLEARHAARRQGREPASIPQCGGLGGVEVADDDAAPEAVGGPEEILADLDGDERLVLRRLLDLDGDGPMTIRQVGDLLGVTDHRVRTIRDAALAKVRRVRADVA